MQKKLPRSPLDALPDIVEIRSQRVMLDETLAELYGVQTKAFNQAVRRNRERFPPDFLLEIDANEWEILRSQIVTLRSGHGRSSLQHETSLKRDAVQQKIFTHPK